ncbi:MAG: DUF190 domain-containing protein [Acidobacteria bacterium]|nr:DUF190 domain-containing protein [Acidobacteriota bacterium]
MPASYRAKLLRLHCSESDRYQGKPLYVAIVERSKTLGIAGATVLRGLEGFGETGEMHRGRLVGHDLPIVITIADVPDKIERLLVDIEPMMNTGMIAVSDADVIRVQKGASSDHV